MKDMLPEYIDELEHYDVDMLEHNLDNNAKDYKVSSLDGALVVIKSLLNKTLRRLGVDISSNSGERDVDAMLRTRDVKVEHRVNYDGDDVWRNGLYVYKGMDLVAFISEPIYRKAGLFDIDRTPSIVVRAALQ